MINFIETPLFIKERVLSMYKILYLYQLSSHEFWQKMCDNSDGYIGVKSQGRQASEIEKLNAKISRDRRCKYICFQGKRFFYLENSDMELTNHFIFKVHINIPI